MVNIFYMWLTVAHTAYLPYPCHQCSPREKQRLLGIAWAATTRLDVSDSLSDSGISSIFVHICAWTTEFYKYTYSHYKYELELDAYFDMCKNITFLFLIFLNGMLKLMFYHGVLYYMLTQCKYGLKLEGYFEMYKNITISNFS